MNVAMERVCGTLEQESSRLTQAMGETIFELFMSLKILNGFREFLPLKLVISSAPGMFQTAARFSLFFAPLRTRVLLLQGRQDAGPDRLPQLVQVIDSQVAGDRSRAFLRQDP